MHMSTLPTSTCSKHAYDFPQQEGILRWLIVFLYHYQSGCRGSSLSFYPFSRLLLEVSLSIRAGGERQLRRPSCVLGDKPPVRARVRERKTVLLIENGHRYHLATVSSSFDLKLRNTLAGTEIMLHHHKLCILRHLKKKFNRILDVMGEQTAQGGLGTLFSPNRANVSSVWVLL